MYDRTLFLCLQIARSDIRPHVKWAANLVIADVKHAWVCMGYHIIALFGECVYSKKKRVLRIN